MKKYLAVIVSCMMMLGFSACTSTENSTADTTAAQSSETTVSEENSDLDGESSKNAETDENKPEETASEPESTRYEPQTADKLVVYFSCTGNTKAVAERIAELCDADIYEIIPSEPYTAEDIDYDRDDCRANLEMNDENARPAIGSDTIDIDDYDTILIGYPIWWGTMPRIINTFLDTYDLSDKTVMPFCTSGSSSISNSVSALKGAEPNADIRDGLRAEDADDSGIEQWLSDNNTKHQ